jgi:hypothetical protein
MPFGVEVEGYIGATLRVGDVVAEAFAVAAVNLIGEGWVVPYRNIGEGRAVMLGKEGVGNSDGEGNGVLPRQARGGTLPVDGDRVGRVLRAAHSVGAVEFVKENIGVQQRVADQRSVIEGTGDVVGKAGV